MKRREFLEAALGLGAGLVAGVPAGWPLVPAGDDDPFAGGQQVGLVPFAGEGEPPLERTLGSGLGGRRYFDLSGLDAGSLEVPTERFFIRTRVSDQLDVGRPWKIRIHGLVEAPGEVPLDRLARGAVPAGTHLLECSGNDRLSRFGLISAGRWSGVRIEELLGDRRPLPAATRVRVSGFDRYSRSYPGSDPGAAWIFSLRDLIAARAFLATGMNGAALPPDHGAPVRLAVPGWYGCTWVKWVDEIEILADDAPITDQMREFAGRTHQPTIPELARDYQPATIDLAALPIRVEEWRVKGAPLYRIVGIVWGGTQPAPRLRIQLGDDAPEEAVTRCARAAGTTWGLWQHAWRPARPGAYSIALRADMPGVRTRRLSSGHYQRRVEIERT
jgi:DMSO/TMAO reductase YedYZ molybdopterin-dependent catalytic subunit